MMKKMVDEENVNWDETAEFLKEQGLDCADDDSPKKYVEKKQARKTQKRQMSEKAIEARRKYRREWAKNNPDKVAAAQERYWLKKAREMGIASKEG